AAAGGVAVDDLEADDAPRRQLRRALVVAPQPQGLRDGALDVHGLVPVPDLRAGAGVAGRDEERLLDAEPLEGPANLLRRHAVTADGERDVPEGGLRTALAAPPRRVPEADPAQRGQGGEVLVVTSGGHTSSAAE